MAYCTTCGKELKDGASFCISCGTKAENKTNTGNKRETVYEGSVHKCPNCGATVKAFLTSCPECGVEFRNTGSSVATKEFLRKLEDFESRRKFRVGDPVDDLILNLIRNYSIPNNKEDIFEFIILAASNINMSVVSARNYAEFGVNSNNEFAYLKAKNDAWISKFNQAYEKANLSFESDTDFYKIKKIYEKTNKSIKKATKRKTTKTALLILGLAICIAIPLVILILAPKDNNTTVNVNDNSNTQNIQSTQNTKYFKEYSYYRKNANGNPENKPAVDISNLDVDGIFPKSDLYTTMFKGIDFAPETIYHTMASENGLRYTPYIFKGKVIKTGTTNFEFTDYMGGLPEQDEEYELFWFIIENEYGIAYIQDWNTLNKNGWTKQVNNGETEFTEFLDTFFDVCGYETYEYPKEGQEVAVLGIYRGMSIQYDIPMIDFGIDELYLDWLKAWGE